MPESKIEISAVSGASLVKTRPVFGPDSKCLFCCSESLIKVFSTESGECIRNLHGHTNTVTGLVVNPNNKLQILSCSFDQSVIQWDYSDGVLLKVYQLRYPLHDIFVSSLQETPVLILKRQTSRQEYDIIECVLPSQKDSPPKIKVLLGSVNKEQCSLAVGCQNKVIATINNTVLYVQNHKKKVRHTLDLTQQTEFTCVACHPTDVCVVTGCQNGRIYYWYNIFRKDKVVKTYYHWHALPVLDLCFTVEGSYLLSGGHECVLVKWQYNSHQKDFLPRLGAPINRVTCSHDNLYYATCHTDNVIKLITNKFDVKQVYQGLTCAHLSVQKKHPVPAGLHYDPRSKALVTNGKIGHLQFYSVTNDKHLYDVILYLQQGANSHGVQVILYLQQGANSHGVQVIIYLQQGANSHGVQVILYLQQGANSHGVQVIIYLQQGANSHGVQVIIYLQQGANSHGVQVILYLQQGANSHGVQVIIYLQQGANSHGVQVILYLQQGANSHGVQVIIYLQQGANSHGVQVIIYLQQGANSHGVQVIIYLQQGANSHGVQVILYLQQGANSHGVQVILYLQQGANSHGVQVILYLQQGANSHGVQVIIYLQQGANSHGVQVILYLQQGANSHGVQVIIYLQQGANSHGVQVIIYLQQGANSHGVQVIIYLQQGANSHGVQVIIYLQQGANSHGVQVIIYLQQEASSHGVQVILYLQQGANSHGVQVILYLQQGANSHGVQVIIYLQQGANSHSKLDIVGQNYISPENMEKPLTVTEVMAADFSCQGDWLATVELWDDHIMSPELRLKFWQFREETQKYTLNTTVELPHNFPVTCVKIRPETGEDDDQPMAVTTSLDCYFKTWTLVDDTNIYRKNKKWTCKFSGYYRYTPANTAAYSDDGSLLCVGFGSVLTIWDPDTNVLLQTLAGHKDKSDVQFIEFGKYSCSHLLTVCSKTSLVTWNLSSCTVLWNKEFSTVSLIPDPETDVMAVISQDSDVYYFRPSSPDILYHQNTISSSGVASAIFIPQHQGRHSQTAHEKGRQLPTKSKLYFINSDHQLLCLSEVDTAATAPQTNFTIQKNLPQTTLSLILSKENTKQPAIDSRSTSKDIQSWKGFLDTPPQVQPAVTSLCKQFVQSMLVKTGTKSGNIEDDEELSDEDEELSDDECIMEVDEDVDSDEDVITHEKSHKVKNKNTKPKDISKQTAIHTDIRATDSCVSDMDWYIKR
ncbi:NAN1 [Mytilus coruscus]|uniref:NAN1 n=1 Tax=Mytilus coruscus TaxID=42192 RepID=A0A6J8B0J9_MYTCO|nr:NAN1 [Mytilus coruscus]